MATLIYCTGFEHGLAAPVVSGGGLCNAVAGAPTIQGTNKRSGDYALECVATGSDVYVQYAFGSSRSIYTARFYIRYTSKSTALHWFLRIQGTQNQFFGVRATANGGWFHVYNATASYVDGNVAPNIETWYRIDLCINGTAGTLDWKIDGAAQTQVAITTGTTGYFFDFGGVTGTFTAQYDDIIISTDAADYPIGEGLVIGPRPNSDGTHNLDSDITDEDGGTTNLYSKLDENPWITTANDDLVKQIGNGTGSYAEINFADTTYSTIHGAMAVLQYAGQSATANEGGCIIIDEDATETTLWGNPTTRQDYSETTPFYKSVILPTPAGGWDAAAVNAIKARIGYSNNTTVNPYWLALMLEVAVSGTEEQPETISISVGEE